MFEAILNSLGVTVAEDYVQDEEVTMYYSDTLKKEDGSPADIMYFRYIPPTEFKENPDDGVK
ncbi:hypothetical protein [Vibrio parahaemolyticus]|nr:hypothetical protein [Vibrio parahaemolyticus]MCX8895411.1 hypothetical protein [Vibrio parahaemolyticus]